MGERASLSTQMTLMNQITVVSRVTMLPHSPGYLSQAPTDQLALFGDGRIELV
jgi:hypothetical protein